jgi:hypothetical protein
MYGVWCETVEVVAYLPIFEQEEDLLIGRYRCPLPSVSLRLMHNYFLNLDIGWRLISH